MGKIIEFIFTRVYVAMLVTGIFWVLTICGGILLGVGPASTTIMSLYAENGMKYKDYHWSRAWELFKENLVLANQVFYTFFAIEGVLFYGMYLMIQIPHLNFFQILVLLFNLVFLLVAPLAYAVYLKLQVHFDLSYVNSIKLSLIGMLLDIRPVLKLILGTALLGVISYYMPALLFFVLIGVWHFFVNDIFDPVYQNIHEKLVS